MESPVGDTELGSSGNPQARMPALRRSAGIPARGFWRHPCRQFRVFKHALKRALPGLACWTLLCLWLATPALQSAEHRPAGREIYRQLCAKCHGPNGEGVKGKYEDALRGDRSLEKLTRYIDRTMPDDDPSQCVGEDAAAVARYIYDAFYSREARLRKNPPRVELVRLTNRQYVNAVADLLKHFTGNDGAPIGERGLRTTYYDAKDFNGDKKLLERVDRRIDFDFNDAGFEPQLASTNGFSIHWRGSVIAEETGDYEFVLKTPNGARLWINDLEEPLVDAWVASGKLDEHTATIRLLGGRIYPLQLRLFKFKDKTASVSLQWKPPRGPRQPIPAHCLSTAPGKATFVVTTKFPPDDSSVGYERGVAVSKAWDEAATQAAIETANYVVANLDRLSQSKPTDTNRLAKVEAFCAEFAATAFRRPLTAAQENTFVSAQFQKAKKPEDAVKRVVLLALKSPRFLYLGLDGGKADDFEIATRLSFGLWDSLPDRELAKLAAAQRLHTREQVQQQAQRMLADPRAHSKMQAFLQHWLQMDRVEPVSKDEKLFPGFTPEIIADLRTSLNLFLEDTVWNGTSDEHTLLFADYVFLNNRLAGFYGVATNATDDFVKVTLDPSQRSGVLTHPYLLSSFAYQKQSSPIHRGVFLTRNIVGRALRPPPIAQTFKDADFAPNLTMREKVTKLTDPPACQTCHSVINPLGFSLEHYDAVGRFRALENDRPIDSVSEYPTDDGQTIRLAGARDVAEFAAASEPAQNAFIEQLFHQVAKQPMLAYGPDVMDRLRQSFAASHFNMQKLLVETATLSAVHCPEKVGPSEPKTAKRAYAPTIERGEK